MPATDMVRPVCSSPEAQDFFFTPGTFYPGRSDREAFRRDWYSRNLRKMELSSLSCGPVEETVSYRFLWLRSFQHPIAITITRKHDEVGVEFVELSGAGGYEPGSILRRFVKRLSLADWEEFDRLVTRSGFWHQPAEDESSEIGADGAQWIIEGRRGNAYHLVDRWSPKDGDHRAIGLFFLERAGVSAVGELNQLDSRRRTLLAVNFGRYLRSVLRPRIPLHPDGDGATMIGIEEVTPEAWRSLARS